MSKNIIETFDLTKHYKLKGQNKKIITLNKVNISVKEGEIFGLLGPNGAGKTTMIRILTTLLQPTSGYAVIDGYNILKSPEKAKSKVALMLESDMLYYRITGYDNLKFVSKIYKIPNYKEKIKIMEKEFGLKKWLHQYVSNYSGGMKMKLALFRTLLLNRKILFLDEPTLGLDVKTTSFIVNKLKNIKNTIFLTSHNMNIVEKLCDRIAFINKGNILKIGTKDDLRRYGQQEIKIIVDVFENKKTLKKELEQQNFIKEIIDTKSGFVVSLKKREWYQSLFLILSKYSLQRVKELDLTLEELFLKFIYNNH